MDVIGTKWTALILRDLACGPKRYGEIQKNININPRTLAQRLDMLSEQGVVESSPIVDSPHKIYDLTQKGRDLIPILEQMATWGYKYVSTDQKTLA